MKPDSQATLDGYLVAVRAAVEALHAKVASLEHAVREAPRHHARYCETRSAMACDCGLAEWLALPAVHAVLAAERGTE